MSFHSTTLLSRDRSDQDNITTVYSISMPNDKFLDPEFEFLRQYSIRFSEQIPVSNSITFGSAIVVAPNNPEKEDGLIGFCKSGFMNKIMA